MRRLLALALVVAPALAGAQRITIRERGTGQGAALLDSLNGAPHLVIGGSGPLVVPRDSTVTQSILVLGRPTYMAGRVRGDVIVVGGDLFLRPGVDISGRAVAIGGTVSETTLGHVGGTIHSLRDETFLVEGAPSGQGVTLSARSLRVGGDAPGIFRLSGIRGLKMPGYDRVNGLSLPVGVQLVLRDEQLVVEPTVTYRSRLGKVDPAVSLRVGPEEDGRRFVGRVARDTRTNDAWITGDIVNSLKTFAFGIDARNYFRSDIAEGRIFVPAGNERLRIEPFVGGRFERVSPVTATGDVYSIFGRGDSDRVRRPNPLVERGDIGSVLAGVLYETRAEAEPRVVTKLRLEAEQSLTAPAGTRNFTQLTADGSVQFPTILTHLLRIRAHAVGTLGDSTPLARYAYLGGSRTLGLSPLLGMGGNDLVFVDSRYLVPVESIQLPVVGPPMLSLIHRIGGAGVGSLGTLQQEVGAGVSFGSPSFGSLDLELIVGASGQRRAEFGYGITLPSF